MILLARAPLRCQAWRSRTCHVRQLATVLREGVTERRTAENLPKEPARTRFAPSPTGYLHLGSLRTAVFNFLVARATGGQFVLRVEDTDQRRTVGDAYKRLYEDLRWAALQWDEGPEIGGPYGPYVQSERASLYTQQVEILLKTENVYRCFCSAKRLQELAKSMTLAGAAGSYDRRCTHVTSEESQDRAFRGETHVVRLKMPDTPPEFTDLTYGTFGDEYSQRARRKKLVASETGYDDPVIVKSDGLPTYHFANVVDDHHMKITHVIRAAEWLSSTPKHIALYEAFGWKPPVFAHVGLLLDSNKQKLSKRTGSQHVQSLREQGILPEALVNHLALLGWSHRFNDDFLLMEDLVKSFDMKFTKGNVVVNDSKLSYLQGKHTASRIEQNPEALNDLVEQLFAVMGKPVDDLQPMRSAVETKTVVRSLLQGQPDQLSDIETFKDRYFDLFYTRECVEPVDMIKSYACEVIQLAQNGLDHTEVWSIESLKSHLEETKSVAEELLRDHDDLTGRTPSKIFWVSLRWALFRGRHGLSVPEVAYYLGRQETMKRLEAAVILGAKYESNKGL